VQFTCATTFPEGTASEIFSTENGGGSVSVCTVAFAFPMDAEESPPEEPLLEAESDDPQAAIEMASATPAAPTATFRAKDLNTTTSKDRMALNHATNVTNLF
jgi:hypothetical protein